MLIFFLETPGVTLDSNLVIYIVIFLGHDADQDIRYAVQEECQIQHPHRTSL